jgi:hypothetical protein
MTEEKSKLSPLSAVIAVQIWMDVTQGLEPQQSRRVKYGTEETALYNTLKTDWEKYKKENPDAMPAIPEL